MAQQIISTGTGPNTGTGDPGFTAWTKANANFTELYTIIGGGGTGTFANIIAGPNPPGTAPVMFVNAGPVIGGITSGSVTINGLSIVGRPELLINGNLNDLWQGIFTRNINAGTAAVNLLEIANDTPAQELVLYNTSTAYTGTTNNVTGPSAGLGGGGSASQRILTIGPCYRQDQGTGAQTWTSTAGVTRATLSGTGNWSYANTTSTWAGAGAYQPISITTTTGGQLDGLAINNTGGADGDNARWSVAAGTVSIAMFVLPSTNTGTGVTGGITGGQALLRVLGAGFPLVFGTNNTYRGQIDGNGAWSFAKPTAGTNAVLSTQAAAGNSSIIQGVDSTGVNTVALQSGATAGFVGTLSNTPFTIFTNNSNRLTVSAAGVVNIALNTTQTTATTASISTVETYISLPLQIPANSLVVGNTFRIRAFGSANSSVSNTVTFNVRLGANGTTADLVIGTLVTTSAASGSGNGFAIDFDIAVQAIGASGQVVANAVLTNTTTAGISTLQAQVSTNGPGTTVNTTGALQLGLSFKTSAATTSAVFNQVLALRVI